jgi:hypothetical protein
MGGNAKEAPEEKQETTNAGIKRLPIDPRPCLRDFLRHHLFGPPSAKPKKSD